MSPDASWLSHHLSSHRRNRPEPRVDDGRLPDSDEIVDDFLFGAVSVVAGVLLILRRKEFAASTVKQQNWLWRRNYGSRQIKHNEVAAIVVGLFAFVLGVTFWFA